jgi:hypothetical protein
VQPAAATILGPGTPLLVKIVGGQLVLIALLKPPRGIKEPVVSITRDRTTFPNAWSSS